MKRKPYELDLSSYALPLERFTRHGDTLTAFESDLRNHPFDGTYHWLRRLFNDACDVGMAIRSHHTGRIVRFTLEREETRDGDLMAFHFTALDDAGPITKVTIFND